METKQRLLQRLEAIGQTLRASDRALALIGLGSVGRELERLDEHSDLDFFVIVETGHKASYLGDLSWLERVAPIAYRFQNTDDGFKLLFEDDIFCEFAVFEPHELRGIPFAAGRIVWKRAQVDETIAEPSLDAPSDPHSFEWRLGEALTNLYVGLKRFHRGEKLSAFRFVQQYALDRTLELAQSLEPEQPAFPDPFSLERRFSQMARVLASLAQGYERTPESALAMLGFLVEHFEVDPSIASAIRKQAVLKDERTDPPG